VRNHPHHDTGAEIFMGRIDARIENGDQAGQRTGGDA